MVQQLHIWDTTVQEFKKSEQNRIILEGFNERKQANFFLVFAPLNGHKRGHGVKPRQGFSTLMGCYNLSKGHRNRLLASKKFYNATPVCKALSFLKDGSAIEFVNRRLIK